jgi:hypothetical protein
MATPRLLASPLACITAIGMPDTGTLVQFAFMSGPLIHKEIVILTQRIEL